MSSLPAETESLRKSYLLKTLLVCVFILLGQDRALLQWLTERDVYLAELLRIEGRGDFIKAPCQSCHMSLLGFGFRCVDCHDLGLYCQNCLVKTHASNPLHCVHVSYLHHDYIQPGTYHASTAMGRQEVRKGFSEGPWPTRSAWTPCRRIVCQPRHCV